MKLYVDELPTLCCYCPFYYGNSQGAVCKLTGIMTKWDETLGEMQSKCPLQLLADHDKQVRKEVCEEIWKEFEQRLVNKTKDMSVINVAYLINSVLDQIQGETK